MMSSYVYLPLLSERVKADLYRPAPLYFLAVRYTNTVRRWIKCYSNTWDYWRCFRLLACSCQLIPCTEQVITTRKPCGAVNRRWCIMLELIGLLIVIAFLVSALYEQHHLRFGAGSTILERIKHSLRHSGKFLRHWSWYRMPAEWWKKVSRDVGLLRLPYNRCCIVGLLACFRLSPGDKGIH